MKLWKKLAVLLLAAALTPSAFAQTPLVRIVADRLAWLFNTEATATIKCPTGYFPITYAETPQFSWDFNTVYQRDLVNSSGGIVSRTTLSSATSLMGGGVTVDIYNEDHHSHNSDAKLICLSAGATSDGTFTLVKSSLSVNKASAGTVTNFCPANAPVALGGFGNGDGIFLTDYGSSPVWGTSAAPVLLSTLPDGQTGPPTGWSSTVFNPNPVGGATIMGFAICGNSPSLQTFVSSAPVPPAVFTIRGIYSTIGLVPDGWTAVGSGFDGGQYAQYYATDLWMSDSNLVDMIQWYPVNNGPYLSPTCSCVVPYDLGYNFVTPYDSGTAEVRGFVQRAWGNGPAGGSARSMVAVLAVPKPSAAPTTVPIVEFYNAALDHYFITANPQEMSDLDNGVHAGWARTGQSFNGYGISSTGDTDRRPVCREYGSPAAGLDSHFYSASPDECLATLVNNSGNVASQGWLSSATWILEAPEVFQMDLPDPITGACPAGGVPVYRTFNQRADANHRYTTSIAIRDQMVAKGGVAEGYGPNAVALCGLP
jgi:hypothetical protein